VAAATVVLADPGRWESLLEAGYQPGEEMVAVCAVPDRAGRWLTAAAQERIQARGARLLAAYGPVAVAGAGLHHEVDPGCPPERGAAPLGRPVPGVAVRITDLRRRGVPPGLPGSLELAGPAVARAAGRPAATATLLRPAPGGRRVLRCELQVREAAGGLVERVGRAGAEIDRRGRRVDLTEIARVLAAHPGVAAAAVEPEWHRVGPVGAWVELLAAVVGPAPGAAPTAVELRSFLAGRVAAEAVPDRFMAAPDPAAAAATPLPPGDRDLVDPAERRVAEIWTRLLGRPVRARDDNFFLLGGTSLLAAVAVTRIERALGAPLPFASFVAAPTVAGVTAAVRRPSAAPR
jgi:hypothetical protein